MAVVSSRVGAAAASACLAASVFVQAQQPPSPPQSVFRAASDLVAVYATVRDGRSALVRGLTRDDFEIRENGVVRDIATFSNDIQPITLAMILDRSGSLSMHSEAVTAAATGFFDALLPGDRVSLGSLTWDCVPLTDDLPLLRRAVTGATRADHGSPIWESIDRAFFAMASEPGRRAILMFSDGVNTDIPPLRMSSDEADGCQPAKTATGATAREVATRAERNGVMVYAVGVETVFGRQHGDLKTIARNTGGDLFPMKAGESLTPVFTQIAEELHSQYLLGFAPTIRDGQSGRIEVRMKRRGLEVRARRSYAVAPDASAAMTSVPVAPLGPLSDEAVLAAIKEGEAGRSLRATCSTPATATGEFFEVALEGPTGRVMRAAREARQRRESLTLADVSSRLRAATVSATAARKVMVLPEPGDPPKAASEPTSGLPNFSNPVLSASAIRLRSLNDTPTLLEPTIESIARFRPAPFESQFALAAVRAIGPSVEAIVYGTKESRCRLNSRALEQVR